MSSNYLDDLVDVIQPKCKNTNLLNDSNFLKNESTFTSTVTEHAKTTDSYNFSTKNESKNDLNFEFQKYYNMLNNTDEFTYRTNNTILTLTLLNSLIRIFYYDLDKYNLSFFVLNIIFLIYYNYLNIDITRKFINNNNLINNCKIASFNTLNYLQYIKQKFKGTVQYLFEYFFDSFFSKNTQMILKIIYNMAKMKVTNTYKIHKNKLFNPPLLTQTTKEKVYVVSFYLNDVTYKIPIIEPNFSFEKKQQPLMILNKNEDDVTQNILQYMGPNNDFFGIVLKPKHLNEKTLNFIMEDGTEINIDENEIIVF